MILSPMETDLAWPAVEPQLFAMIEDLERIYQDNGHIPPENTGEDYADAQRDHLLTTTANALKIPLAQIYAARHRINWRTELTTAGLATSARIDGGGYQSLTNTNYDNRNL